VPLATATAASAGGNSANAKACQKGGWQQLVRADATTFTNEEACVSYAAHGGVFMTVGQAWTATCLTIPPGNNPGATVGASISSFGYQCDWYTGQTVPSDFPGPQTPGLIALCSSVGGSYSAAAYQDDWLQTCDL
jgi:hypothetical protein